MEQPLGRSEPRAEDWEWKGIPGEKEWGNAGNKESKRGGL